MCCWAGWTWLGISCSFPLFGWGCRWLLNSSSTSTWISRGSLGFDWSIFSFEALHWEIELYQLVIGFVTPACSCLLRDEIVRRGTWPGIWSLPYLPSYVIVFWLASTWVTSSCLSWISRDDIGWSSSDLRRSLMSFGWHTFSELVLAPSRKIMAASSPLLADCSSPYTDCPYWLFEFHHFCVCHRHAAYSSCLIRRQF